MFKNCPRFNGDVNNWKGEVTQMEQENIFEGADSFNAKYECSTEFDGPTSMCRERNYHFLQHDWREELSEFRHVFESS